MKTRVCFHDIENEVPTPGYEFYMVDVTWTNTGDTRRDGYTKPQRTNRSGEERVSGWLGTTDNISLQAMGKYRVDEVLSELPQEFQQGVLVNIKKISN
jgi:hypothetical protein